MKPLELGRRAFLNRSLQALSLLGMVGCDRLSRDTSFQEILSTGETLSPVAHNALLPRKAMAQEFGERDLSPYFRSNGTSNPDNPDYQALVANGFRDWRLEVEGMVKNRLPLSIAQLRMMQTRTQITRHDCVEGWSAIAKWTGIPLADVIAAAHVLPDARFAVFHCADPMDGTGSAHYYEGIHCNDAFPPQTILARQGPERKLSSFAFASPPASSNTACLRRMIAIFIPSISVRRPTAMSVGISGHVNLRINA